MNGFETFQMYLGIKAHFINKNYNYFKYGKKTSATVNSFTKRKDRYFFEKIEKKLKTPQIQDLFVSNFVENDAVWIGDFLDETAMTVYRQWMKRTQSLEYNFKNDMEKIGEYLQFEKLSFDDLFACSPEKHPIILNLVLGKTISIETYAILDYLVGFEKRINKILVDDPYWKTLNGRYSKYAAFLDLEPRKEKFKKMAYEALHPLCGA